ncbi:MAG: F0F1 ATP synthase subunit gamma [Candidatus Levybacteria bacterium]|nr:F0F1 ATP synthase subunit gamma [Candidatus Levybacteria bacterium]
MVSKNEVIEKFNSVTTFKNVIETYEEIAASRMQNARSSVLQRRDFISELNDIFQQIKTSYKDELEKLMKKRSIKDHKKLTFIERNGKTLFVLLSSNTGLYGDIIKQSFDLFIELVKKESCDAIIIGKVGLDYFKNTNLKIPYAYFDFPDSKIDNEKLKNIVKHIINYERTFIVYGQFQNIITQKPIVTSISGDPLPQEAKGPKIKYFFEPSLEKIMAFFEAEIFSSIFEQTIFESQLAKFASRMTSLEIRVEKIKELLKLIEIEKQKVKHRIMNKKQLDALSSISLWS